MIKVIEQSTEDYYREVEELFTTIRPFLDEGYGYRSALKKVGRITRNSSISRDKPRWFKDLRIIGEKYGYKYKDYFKDHKKR